MAEQFIQPLVESLVGKLVDKVIQEIKSMWGVEEEIDNLYSTLSTINAVLKDAENKQLTDEAVKGWLRKLKDVAYDADDVLDKFAYEALRSKVEGTIQTSKQKKVRNVVFSCFTCKPLLFRHEMADRIKAIQEKLENIAKERQDYHLNVVSGDKGPETKRRAPTGSLIEEPVLGREDDREDIIKMLLGSDDFVSSDEIFVIPIVGGGGLGKTTLARFVYNDERIVDYFPIRVWVCVSEEFDIIRITKAISESIDNEPCQFNEIDRIQISLKKMLSGKRFLLILDDVWNESLSQWMQLRAPLTYGAKGSSIIVTTRSLAVSKMMGTIPSPYHLKCLSHDDGWSLFSRRAFLAGNSNVPQRLVQIGHEIVEKCKGLPLAIGALGGLLRYNLDESKWEDILESDIWELSEAKKDIFPILKISYNYLPTHLKQCFAYCSLFPKGHKFRKDDVIKQWIAEGFIQRQHNRLLEDTGFDYFDDLLWRSFFQHSEHYEEPLWRFSFQHLEHYRKPEYMMHDLIHDLARSISGDEYFRVEDGSHKMGDINSLDIFEKVRHSSFVCKESDRGHVFEAFHESKKLRTFMLFKARACFINQVPRDFFLKLGCLRVLDLSDTSTEELPDSIGNLRHLRYVNLSSTHLQRLPESVTSLYNLQVLKLEGCSRLSALPTKINNLINLRHLVLRGCCVISMPPGIGKLTNLLTLDEFVVGKEPGCGIRELKDLKHLRGEICISNLENVTNAEETNTRVLETKRLAKLTLQWSDGRDNNSENRGIDEKILEALEPHTNLKELTITSYSSISFPRWMMVGSHFCKFNITRINLERCLNCELLPPFCNLGILKVLHIKRLNRLTSFRQEVFGGSNTVQKAFPLLEELYLFEMDNLEELAIVQEGDMPCLGKLCISGCPKLQEISTFASLRELQLSRCNAIILKKMPHLTSLTSLSIENFEELTSFPERMLQRLPALKRLTLSRCSELVSWPKEVGLHTVSTLEELQIEGCPKLEKLPDEEGFPTTLRVLSITRFNNLRSIPIHGLRNLTSLQHLELVTELASFPEVALPLPITLQYLEIFTSHNLKTLPMDMLENLSSLRYLHIVGCSQLEALPMLSSLISLQVLEICSCAQLNSLKGLPPTLRDLTISTCDNLRSLPMLNNITFLGIHSCPQLEPLVHPPKGVKTLRTENCCWDYLHQMIQFLTSLESLEIINCPHPELFTDEVLLSELRDLTIIGCENLGSLPVDMKNNLPCLQRLTIRYCRQLLFLPEDGLPSSLRSIYIDGCHELVYQCLEGGSYWSNISHIPDQYFYGYSSSSD